jgi:KUP system potassium uptake protein
MIMVVLLVLSFRTSSNLTAAYGIAVTGAMFIDNVLLAVVLFKLWRWHWAGAVALLSVFYRRRHGLSRREPDQDTGRRLGPAADRLHHLHAAHHMVTRAQADASGWPNPPCRSRSRCSPRAAHTARPACRAPRLHGLDQFDGVPSALLHNIKHNKVLHERRDPDGAIAGRAPCRGCVAAARCSDLGNGASTA